MLEKSDALAAPASRTTRERLETMGAWVAHRGWLLAVLLALPALLPLLRAGFFVSDDGLFHVYRIAALADAWEHGVLYPRLFPQFGFGYGQAVLNFYAPLSYAPGALLASLGISPVDAAEWTIALGFILAALAAYGMGKYLWGVAGGLLAAVVYTYFPYHLADAYLRGALPEHMAFIFLPLIVWATVAGFRAEHPVASYLGGSLAWAGLVYTHNLTVLLMALVWIVLVLVLGLATGKWKRFWGAAGSVGLAVGLSAWLWLPFLAENRFVGIGLGASDGWKQHLAPLGQLIQTLPLYQYRIGHGTGMAEHPVNWPAALLAVVVLMVLFLRQRRGRPVAGASMAVFGVLLAAVAVLMTAQPSSPVWAALQPVLGQLQYPWRFMTLCALGLTIAAGAALGASRPAKDGTRAQAPLHVYAFVALVALVGLAFVVNGLGRVPSQRLEIAAAEAWGVERMWDEDAANGQVGATWTGEFLPRTVQEQRWALGRPREGAQDSPALSPSPNATLSSVGYGKLTLTFAANPPAQLRLHQFHLPAWRAWVDGAARTTYPSGELGLVTLDVPPGARTVAFQFGPSSPVIVAGVIVAVAALCWAVLAWMRPGPGRRGRGWTAAGVVLLLLVISLLANQMGLGVRTWTPARVQATAGDMAQLIGYDAAPARGERGLDVTLYWLALRESAQNYKVFVHLLGPDGQVLAQHDGDPVGGYSPTTRWRQGELIADTHRLLLDDQVQPGQYEVRAGMYEIRPGESPEVHNLSVTPPAEDQRIVLGDVSVP